MPSIWTRKRGPRSGEVGGRGGGSGYLLGREGVVGAPGAFFTRRARVMERGMMHALANSVRPSVGGLGGLPLSGGAHARGASEAVIVKGDVRGAEVVEGLEVEDGRVGAVAG